MAILKQVDGKALFNVPDEVLEQYAIPEDKIGEALKDTRIKLGTPVTPEEIQGKQVITADVRGDQQADASASYLYWTTVICPSCNTARRVMVSSEVYNVYECGNCGYRYRA
jgi:predicted RNA-binding Zn-ribbon protein involved in translation (DUF1610 family)